MSDPRDSTSENSARISSSDSRYEIVLVILLFLTWGAVFLDRMSLLYLSPYVAPALHLSHKQIGLLAAALAVAWAFSSLIFGAISDRFGRRPVLIPAVFSFSVLSWLSGAVHSFGQLYLVRTLMGAAEGPTWSTITATIEESSAAEHRGRNVGIVVSAAALVGHAVAPVLTTQVGARFGWRTAFYVAGVPGIILAVLLWKYLREPRQVSRSELQGKREFKFAKEDTLKVTGPGVPRAPDFSSGKVTGSMSSHRIAPADYLTILPHRNIWLCCLASAGFMTWLWVMHAFAPFYITEVTRHSPTFAGFVLGASGLGEFLWGWILPWVSDRVGRKPVLLFVALISALVPLTYQMPYLIEHPWLMALAGFLANGGQGMAALVLVLIPTESVPARFAGTAIGLSTLVGEIFGGTLAPWFSGAMADRYGLATPLWIAAGGAVMVFLAGLFIRETAPFKLNSKAAGTPAP